ncbi:hypothetical protein BpHYR1_041733 [Brachionus plicatilis]|uniref:Uncharacterized protein n=1 Tax=Brachionus plicatilis TaxID=10195 RepID=A0A3M7S7X0_BRAPC|nr:hypothetical protein BpHYR1_041733 [Brachionus plicatilis]
MIPVILIYKLHQRYSKVYPSFCLTRDLEQWNGVKKNVFLIRSLVFGGNIYKVLAIDYFSKLQEGDTKFIFIFIMID